MKPSPKVIDMGEIDIVISKKDGQDQEVASSVMNEVK